MPVENLRKGCSAEEVDLTWLGLQLGIGIGLGLEYSRVSVRVRVRGRGSLRSDK